MLEEFGEICVVIILVIGMIFLTVMVCSFANGTIKKPKFLTKNKPSFEMPMPKKPSKLYYQVIDQEAEDEARLEHYYESIEP